MTYMLIGVSMCFMVLTTPLGIFVLVWTYKFNLTHMTVSELLTWTLSINYLYLIYYVNSIVNFWIYAVAGRRFRDELKRIFGCGVKTGS